MLGAEYTGRAAINAYPRIGVEDSARWVAQLVGLAVQELDGQLSLPQGRAFLTYAGLCGFNKIAQDVGRPEAVKYFAHISSLLDTDHKNGVRLKCAYFRPGIGSSSLDHARAVKIVSIFHDPDAKSIALLLPVFAVIGAMAMCPKYFPDDELTLRDEKISRMQRDHLWAVEFPSDDSWLEDCTWSNRDTAKKVVPLKSIQS